MSEPRRNPAPPTVAFYKQNAEKMLAAGQEREAYLSLREAFNHLENAAYAHAEDVDSLLVAARKALVELNFCVEVAGRRGGLYEQARDALVHAIAEAERTIAITKGTP
jgi:hypothetical protein